MVFVKHKPSVQHLGTCLLIIACIKLCDPFPVTHGTHPVRYLRMRIWVHSHKAGFPKSNASG